MDPITHGLAGAAIALALRKQEQPVLATFLLGAGAAMLPDLDVLIGSHGDPLSHLLYHRHFTHSLIFIPFGGLLAALIARLTFARTFKFLQLWFLATLAFASHCLIDSSTSYGTQLFWPFSDKRVAWDIVSIIDPIVTLLLLVGVIMSCWKRSVTYARTGLLLTCLYFAACIVQHQRAEQFIQQVAQERGHLPAHISARPSFFNNIVFRTIYRNQDTYFVDAVRAGWLTKPSLIAGGSILSFDQSALAQAIIPDSQTGKDLKRFRWFADDYLVLFPNEENVIGDLRYSTLPNEITPIWGIRVDLDHQDRHVSYESFRRITAEMRQRFYKMVLGPS